MLNQTYLNTVIKNLQALDVIVNNISPYNINSAYALIYDTTKVLLITALDQYNAARKFDEVISSGDIIDIYNAIPKQESDKVDIYLVMVKLINSLHKNTTSDNVKEPNITLAKDCYEMLHILLCYMLMYMFSSEIVSCIVEDIRIGSNIEVWAKHNIDTIRVMYTSPLERNDFNEMLLSHGIISNHDSGDLEYLLKCKEATRMKENGYLE